MLYPVELQAQIPAFATRNQAPFKNRQTGCPAIVCRFRGCDRAKRCGHTCAAGRGGRIRTCDLLLPKQLRYQAALHPG